MTGSITAEKLFIHTDPGTGNGSGDVRLDKLLAKVISPGCGRCCDPGNVRAPSAANTAHWQLHMATHALMTRQEAVILARDLEPVGSAAAQPQDGASWGGVHITALYAEEAHIKGGATAAPLSGCALS